MEIWCRAYNPFMLDTFNSLVSGAALERATLVINHVLAGEPMAMQRLKPHVGRCVQLQFEGWPGALPPLPSIAFRVTPAGLLEWCGPESIFEADLRVSINASNPALAMVQALTGQRPKVEVAGDAAFATDLNWLFDNLRWDVQEDLARIVGQVPARELARLGSGVAQALRSSVQMLGALARLRLCHQTGLPGHDQSENDDDPDHRAGPDFSATAIPHDSTPHPNPPAIVPGRQTGN